MQYPTSLKQIILAFCFFIFVSPIVDIVKNALVNIYNISNDRLTTDGKGEKQPVGDNKTTNGKAQNRRVEFIKT